MTFAAALAPLIGLAIVDSAAVADFLALGLPSLLAPANLPALSSRLRLRIVGDGACLAALRRPPVMNTVAARFATTFIARAVNPDSWAAELADPEIRGLPVLRLDPRVVWSDGALSAIAVALATGAARVETICLPVAADVLRAALADRDAPPTAAFLAALVTEEATRPKAGGANRRASARQQPGVEPYRRIGPSRVAVHAADWDVVGQIAGGAEQPVTFLDNPRHALALHYGHRAIPAHGDLVRQLAASHPARQRFRRRFELGEGATVASEIAAVDRDIDEIERAVGAAIAKVRGHLLIAAWTRPYIELFLRLTLPSLMSPGNLPRLEAADRRLPATIMCLSADRATCEQSPAFVAFARQRAIDWRFIDDIVAVLGDAREAVLSTIFRAAMAEHWDPEADLAFLLIKPGHVLADGTLAAIVRKVEEGARAVLLPTPRIELPAALARLEETPRGASARMLARAVLDGATEEALLLPIAGRMLPAVSDHIAVKRGPDRLAFRAARWHPAALRPRHPVQPARQSLLDTEIVPEFADDDSDVHRVASSDEALIVDARTASVRSGAEPVTVGELAQRIAMWATAWHRRNLDSIYDLIAADDQTPSTDDPVPRLALPNASPAVPARRHPVWLAARALTEISPQSGEAARYQSDLDGYYRVARLAIEAAVAQEVIYAGHATHVFAPLLARCFKRAYLAAADRLLADPDLMRDPERTTLHILQLDLTLFQSLCLTGKADRFLLELPANAQPVILIVESPDSQGGLQEMDFALAREWETRLTNFADALGVQVTLQSTLVDFFDGHPGFVVRIMPNSAPTLALVAAHGRRGRRLSAGMQHPSASNP
jgi:hypothetical protein